MSHLWKVTAKRDNGKVEKGMSVEIIKKGTDRKPTQKEICEALNDKYGENISQGSVVSVHFDFEKLS